MAVHEPIGLNFNDIGNYNLTIDVPSKASELIPTISNIGNTTIGPPFTLIMLCTYWFIYYCTLSDKSQYGAYKYSDIRAANISFGVCGVLGITFIEAGIFANYRYVAIFMILFIATFIFMLSYEHKE